MSPAPRLLPDQQAGGTYFSNCSQLAPLFQILISLNLFLKKTLLIAAWTIMAVQFDGQLGWAVAPPDGLAGWAVLPA
jgi:hypothetical protein